MNHTLDPAYRHGICKGIKEEDGKKWVLYDGTADNGKSVFPNGEHQMWVADSDGYDFFKSTGRFN